MAWPGLDSFPDQNLEHRLFLPALHLEVLGAVPVFERRPLRDPSLLQLFHGLQGHLGIGPLQLLKFSLLFLQ